MTECMRTHTHTYKDIIKPNEIVDSSSFLTCANGNFMGLNLTHSSADKEVR